jgi:hypothetical protein
MLAHKFLVQICLEWIVHLESLIWKVVAKTELSRFLRPYILTMLSPIINCVSFWQFPKPQEAILRYDASASVCVATILLIIFHCFG